MERGLDGFNGFTLISNPLSLIRHILHSPYAP